VKTTTKHSDLFVQEKHEEPLPGQDRVDGAFSYWVMEDDKWYYKRFHSEWVLVLLLTFFIPIILMYAASILIDTPKIRIYEYYTETEMLENPSLRKFLIIHRFFEILIVVAVMCGIGLLVLFFLAHLRK